jgi:NADPH:quinone reductase-like Zn-dependent oxidoreductase
MIDVPTPEIGASDVLVRVRRSFKMKGYVY